MNRIGIYFAYWERNWQADYISYIRKVKRLGFDVLEVEVGALEKMSGAEQDRIAQAARDEGIDLTYCIGLPPQYDLASRDESVRRCGIAYVGRLLDVVHHMGGDMLGGIIYACWPMAGQPSFQDKQAAREQALRSVKELAGKAEALGITYCLEIVNRFEQCVLNTAAEGRAFVEEVGSPGVGLLLDTFHMNIEEDTFRDAILTAGRRLAHFHIGECNRKVPGMRGHMDWDEIAAALQEIGYQGRIVMEPFLKPGGQVGKDIRVYRDLGDGIRETEMDELAARGAAFIRGKLGQK